MFDTLRKGTGTREWSESSYNIQIGCENGCRFCFARYNALKRFKTIETLEQWREPRMLPRRIKQRFRQRKGVIMFPTQHDITPLNFHQYINVLERMLEAGNSVLIVSRPHWACIDELAHRLIGFRNQIIFRFSLGTLNQSTIQAWEPYAPNVEERLRCLDLVVAKGYQTSVSAEPLLTETERELDELILCLSRYNLESIWLGFMNKAKQRVLFSNSPFAEPFRKVLFKQLAQINKLWMARVCRAYAQEFENIRLKDGLRKFVAQSDPQEDGQRLYGGGDYV